MPDRFEIRPDEKGWLVCDREGAANIRDARPIRGGLRVEDADELAYEMSHDPELVDGKDDPPASG